MAKVIVDDQSVSLAERTVLVKAKRRNRQRYPEGCVTVFADADAARAAADPAKNLHPALVYGPSVSSESQRIYYLVKWLD